ncbi:hypothetical protein PIB30_089054, partial [Stylosanthes scabra]|nr:hypothetical protein [Stylosanthes scabra]
MENENHVAIEFQAMLEKALPLFSTKSCCIYKVPHQIRRTNEEAYTPMVVSIGPLHHGNPSLLNMESQKQCHYPEQHYITDYVGFLKQLVNSNKDADVLIKAGIIRSTVSGNDTSVARLFRDVDRNLIVSGVNADYVHICNDLNAYYKHPYHTKVATLRRDYFTTPWKTAASIAGIV